MRYRPGYAAVQYGDLRGEAAADFFQDMGFRTDLQNMARDLGWKGKGRVVGMNLSLGERNFDKTTLHCFYLTLLITDEYDIDTLKQMIKESDGVLPVRTYTIHLVDILNVVKLFKRFEIGLFTKLIEPTEVAVIIIAHLNGHYEGDATGETFRRSGKTDIRIENNDRAAFVAECKVWRGACEFSQAINQLLDYLTWRDCKTSLIIFNKHNSGFKQIQDQLPELLKRHSQFEKNLDCKTHGEWRCIFRSMDDPERKVIVHIFVFNLYVKKRV